MRSAAEATAADRKRFDDRLERGLADRDADHNRQPLAALRTPATPSWLILTPLFTRTASAIALSGLPCACKVTISRTAPVCP
jgi:hypothetical protein